MKMEEDGKEERKKKMQFKAGNGRGGAEEEMREIRSVQNFLPPARLLLLRILFLPHSFIPNLKFLREKKKCFSSSALLQLIGSLSLSLAADSPAVDV